MKKIVTSYTFDASAKTIDSADFTSLEKILLITNVTDQIIIYNFADTAKGGSLASTVLTLEHDTTAMDDTDKLQIFVENTNLVQGTTPSDTQPVSASSLPLPTGAATSAKQDTIIGHVDGIETLIGTTNTSVGSIDTKTPALGQALAAASVPVVLTAAQITTLTPPAAITGFATETTLASIKDTSGIKKITDALPAGTNLLGKVSIDQATANANEVVTKSGSVTAATLSAETTKVIGTVNIAAAQTLATVTTVGAVTAITNALPAGTNGIGKLTANSGVDIGDVDILSIAAGDNNIGNVDLASAIPAGTNAIGKLLPPDVDVTAHTNYAKKYYTNAGAVTDGIIWSPAAGKRWHVTSLIINTSAASTITLEDDLAAGDSPVMKFELAANSGISIPFDEKYPLASGEDAADLIITTTAGNIYCTVVGYEV